MDSARRSLPLSLIWVGLALTVATALLLPATTRAATANVAFDSLEPALEELADGSGALELKLENQTSTALALSAVVKGATDCQLGLTPTSLPASTETAVSVLLPADCDLPDPLALELTTAAEGAPPQTREITPKGSTEEDPDWNQLWIAFGGALGFSLVLLAFLFGRGWTPKEEKRRRLDQRLSSLEATWKLNENWATNVTAAGALLTGLFSATTAKAFLGEEAEALTALATVGAGIALVLVAAATIAALALKSSRIRNEETGSKDRASEAFTVGGILLAALLVLAAAVGQLWITTYTLRELGFEGAEILSWIAFGIGILLLVTYTWRSLRDTFEVGVEEKEEKPPVEMAAAERIAKAIEVASGTGSGTSEMMEEEYEFEEFAQPRVRSALL